jgi:hypothetical protein
VNSLLEAYKAALEKATDRHATHPHDTWEEGKACKAALAALKASRPTLETLKTALAYTESALEILTEGKGK